MKAWEIYTHLNAAEHEIRLVRLKSLQYTLNQNCAKSEIICELQHSSLETYHSNKHHSNHEASYLALSYAWGAEHDAASIKLSGTHRPISANLFHALQQLRQKHDDVLLWVDQLSINQDDDAEKSRQVQLMKRIYQHAAEVVAWLGTQADGSEVVMCTLKHILQLQDEKSRKLLLDVARELKLSTNAIVDGQGHENREDEIVQSVVDIMRSALPAFTTRSYWCRLWILQEFVVATKLTILVGTDRMESADFDVAWKVLGKYVRQPDDANGTTRKEPPSHLQRLGQAWRSRGQWWDAWLSIVRLTYQRRMYQRHEDLSYPNAESLYLVMYKVLTTFGGQIQMLCADPRDRVFSLLGMAQDADDYESFPGYKRPFESIYAEVSQKFIQQGHVDLLGFCQTAPDEGNSGMPSWCVDWRRKIRLPISGKLGMEASNGCKFALDCKINNERSIKLNGSCVGRVAEHGTYLPHNQPLSSQQICTYVAELQNFCLQSPLIEAHEKDVACAFLAAPAALAYTQNNTIMLAEYRAVVQFLHDNYDDQETMTAEPDVNTLSSYARELRFQLFRCPFITEQGHVGIASPFVQAGDLICVFPGGCSVYVLRPTGPDRFVLVCDAYVHGVMHGQYFREERIAQSFTLI